MMLRLESGTISGKLYSMRSTHSFALMWVNSDSCTLSFQHGLCVEKYLDSRYSSLHPSTVANNMLMLFVGTSKNPTPARYSHGVVVCRIERGSIHRQLSICVFGMTHASVVFSGVGHPHQSPTSFSQYLDVPHPESTPPTLFNQGAVQSG